MTDMQMRHHFLRTLTLLTGLLYAITLQASDSIRVSLLTFEPGNAIYELEGHSALRLQSPEVGDITVNWGLFDFSSPNFVYRFVKGETDYMCGMSPTDRTLYQYRCQERQVTEQELNLTDAQARRVIDMCLVEASPGHNVYRYNYVKDNCALRVLNLLEKAIGDTITLGETPAEIADSPTFRREMKYYHRNYPWYQFGIDLALGSGIDYAISTRETAFAPVVLEQLAATATLHDPSGRDIPLVRSTKVIVEGRPGGVVLPPTPFYESPLFVCWTVFVLTCLITLADFRRRHISRWFDTLLYIVMGIAGLVLTFLIFVSVHEATSPNWLYLWLNPLSLVAAVAIWLKKWKIIVFYYQIVNFVALLALCIIGATGIQTLNAAFYPLIFSAMMRAAVYIRQCKNHDAPHASHQ